MDFLWRWRGDSVHTPLQEPTNSEARDRPASQAAGNKGANLRVSITDEEKWKTSMARWRPEIKPTDSDFINKKHDFEKDVSAASGLSIDDVLRKHFSRYEIRKLNNYADKKRETHLYAIQREETVTYKNLLKTEAWRAEGERPSLSTKLTMAYFGLPVEPMTMSDLFPGLKPGFLDDVDDQDAASEPDGIFVPEDKRPLRFLNHYDKRGWGKDNSHMMPNQTFEGYYRLPWVLPRTDQPQHDRSEHVSAYVHDHSRDHHDAPGHLQSWDQYVPGLRGGGIVSDDENSFMGDDVEDDISIVSDTSMEEDAQCAISSNHDQGVSLRGGAGPRNKGEMASLYGFLGRQLFEVNKVQTFFAAIDLLLALEDRRDSKGGGIPLTVAFLVTDSERTKRSGVCRQIVRGQIGQSPQLEQALYDEVLRVRSDIIGTLTDNVSKVVLFVCYQYQDRRFREGQGRELAFQPDLKGNDCIRFSSPSKHDDPREESPAAYLWMPPNVWGGTSSHLYEEWFRAVLHASSYYYDDPDDSLGRRKAQQLRPFLVTIGVFQFHSQTPLPREAWGWLVGQFDSGTRHINILREEPGAFATYSVPGFALQLSGPRQDNVIDLAWRSIPQEDRATVIRIDINPWDAPFQPRNPDEVSFTVLSGDIHREGELYQEESHRLAGLLRQRRALIVQPRWQWYRVHIVHDRTELATVRLYLEAGITHHWHRALRLIRDQFEKAKLWRDNCVVRIDQGNPLMYDRVELLKSESDTTLEYQLRNRTSWEFEPEESHEMIDLWQKFKHLVSFKDLEVSLVPKADQDGKVGLGNPLGLRTLDPERFIWGYNPPRFVKLEEPAVRGSANAPTEHNPIHPPGRETQHEQETRATGFEPSAIERGALNDIGLGKVPFKRDHLPGLQPLDLAQRGKAFREWSYGSPLSVNMNNQHPEIPINAPPVELLLKQRGPDGLASTSLPVISTQILTPTEQRRLQESYFQMRSIALNRGQLCPHKGCRAYFPVGPDNMDKFHAHLEQKHVGTHCPFCPETLFAHWPPKQKQRHFVDNHSEYFTRKGDILKEARLAEDIKNRGLVHRREEQYNFCPRCGRNHNILNSKADRTQHDNVCFPGNTIRDANTKYCIFCGNPEFTGSGAPNDPWAAHDCQLRDGAGAKPASDSFCTNCSLPCSRLGVSYARRHLLNCKPPDTGRDNWCPWCGIDLKSGPLRQRLQHLKDCMLKPLTGENPDHIDRHYERIIADETISKSDDWGSREVRDAFRRRARNYPNSVRRKAELQRHTGALNEERSYSTRENQTSQAAGQGSGTSSPAQSATRRFRKGGPTIGGHDDDDELGLSFQPSGSGRRRTRAGGDVSENDTLYRPDRRGSDGEDDDYQEGLVPEPNPDLEITMKAKPARPTQKGQTQKAGAKVQDKKQPAGQGTTSSQPSPAAESTQGKGQKRPSAATSKPAKKQRTTGAEASEPRTLAAQARSSASPGSSALGSSSRRRTRTAGAPVTSKVVGSASKS
ncbi:hypothetical protein SLS53_008500 [Cytospora paraplurivora]|uniref:Uncharacterized protein n=1 Tax=Cytospora paraplurivora TaxID=2898453 RepID=A0AAN9YBF3_9PEZI